MNAYWLDNGKEITVEQLKSEGVGHARLDPQKHQSGLDKIKKELDYSSQDIVEITPGLPDVETILAKFDKEHFHDNDEVRYVLAGSGIFDIRARNDKWMRVEVFASDYISIPANRFHRFFVMEDKFIRCIRLFKENPVWTPFYREEQEKALV